MKPARIILIGVALVAGGLAAVFALNSGPSPQVETTSVAEPKVERKVKVLVASRNIGIGERLSPSTVSWQTWPEDAIRAEFITDQRLPDAPEQMQGTISRFEIFAGEPIREAKLVRTEQGYLSAVIGKGMRGVSIEVSAASGSGGFIVPNDRVDVILTRGSSIGEVSQTILNNVRVLAIGTRLGEIGTNAGADDGEQAEPKTFIDETIATLELTPKQAESVINSAKIGDLSLVLRSIVDFVEGPAVGGTAENSTVRLIRAGKTSSALSNRTQESEPNVAIDIQPSEEPSVFSELPIDFNSEDFGPGISSPADLRD